MNGFTTRIPYSDSVNRAIGNSGSDGMEVPLNLKVASSRKCQVIDEIGGRVVDAHAHAPSIKVGGHLAPMVAPARGDAGLQAPTSALAKLSLTNTVRPATAAGAVNASHNGKRVSSSAHGKKAIHLN